MLFGKHLKLCRARYFHFEKLEEVGGAYWGQTFIALVSGAITKGREE